MIEISNAELLLILGAGVISGGLNALGGGGSLVSFPSLIAVGLPPIMANASNTAAQWPGSLSAALTAGQNLKESKLLNLQLLLPTVIGAALGAWALLRTPEAAFEKLIPVLILVATFTLAIRLPKDQSRSHRRGKWLGSWQVLISTYGGYFGAGMGLMMLAAYRWLLDTDFHAQNATKNLQATFINFTSAIVLSSQGAVIWKASIGLAIGSMLGGFLCIKLSKKVPADRLRFAMIAYGLFMTFWFGWRAWQ